MTGAVTPSNRSLNPMQTTQRPTAAADGQRARVVADAVVSAYIHEIAQSPGTPDTEESTPETVFSLPAAA
jgi:hypothetical protein